MDSANMISTQFPAAGFGGSVGYGRTFSANFLTA
jgi:hypothetical protein